MGGSRAELCLAKAGLMSFVRGALSIERVSLAIAVALGGCSTTVPLAGDPMPPAQVTTFMKVITPANQYDRPPKFLRGFAPKAPGGAEKGIWGFTEVVFYIQPDGSTNDVRIIQTTADEFAWAAGRAVQNWKFEPALKNGHPIRVRARIPFTFRT